MLVDGLDITIAELTTGEILRSLTLDPTRKYQPQNRNSWTQPVGSGVSYVLTHDNAVAVVFSPKTYE